MAGGIGWEDRWGRLQKKKTRERGRVYNSAKLGCYRRTNVNPVHLQRPFQRHGLSIYPRLTVFEFDCF